MIAKLIQKIKDAAIVAYPFPHLLIHDFLEPNTLQQITSDPAIKLPKAETIRSLHQSLIDAEWSVRIHPGCFKSIGAYIEHRENPDADNLEKSAGSAARGQLLEGAGIAYSYEGHTSTAARDLLEGFRSPECERALREKFAIERDCNYTARIHKYLDRYEISPHPDIREKALTFMLNLNTNPHSEAINHHTHFLRFKPEKEYVYQFWDHCTDHQRCWVPWDWCSTVFQQRANNSISIFAPNSYTLHAVQAVYDDLDHQRTQLYGNLFYEEPDPCVPCEFAEIDRTWAQQRTRLGA